MNRTTQTGFLMTAAALLALAALVLLARGLAFDTAGAAGANYYVSTSGSDSNAGTSSQPFRTVQRAADLATAGDTVHIAPGKYNESVSIDNSGTSGAPIVFRGTAPGVSIDGQCNSSSVIRIGGDYVTLRDIGAERGDEAVVWLDSADYVTLERMRITDWNCGEGEDQYRAGVSSWGGGRNLTVRGSYFERRVDVPGQDVGYGNGIWVKNTGPTAGGGHLFEDNTIVGGWDGIGGEPEDYSWGVFNKNTTIQRNTIDGCDDDGIQVEGGVQNVVVANNTIKRCLIGIAFAPALNGPLTIVRNVISDSRNWRGQGAAMFKVGDSSVAEVRVYHNSYMTGGESSDGFKQTNSNMENIHLLNNAIFVSRYAMETYTHTGPMSADYDALWSTDPERLVKWANQWYRPLSAFQAAGYEAHGISTANFGWDANLRPQAGSALIDRGVRIPGVNDNFSGAAPDIGAFEYGSPNPTPAPTAPPMPPPTPKPTVTAKPTLPPPPAPTNTPARTATPTKPPATPTNAPTTATVAPTPTPRLSPWANPQTPKPQTPEATPVPTIPVVLPSPDGQARFSGDVDCDGWVTGSDGVRLLEIAAGNRDFSKCTHIVDVDCDGELTGADALAIILYIIRTDTRLPVGCPLDPKALP